MTYDPSKYQILFDKDGYYVADEEGIGIDQRSFRTMEEAGKAIDDLIRENEEAKAQENLDAGKYAYACGYRD